jgi:hypothetical protein
MRSVPLVTTAGDKSLATRDGSLILNSGLPIPTFQLPGSGPLLAVFSRLRCRTLSPEERLRLLRIWETTMTSYLYASSLNDTYIRASETRARLDTLARFLDSAIRVPGTNIRFGADALLNLIPGVGMLTSKGMSAYLIWEARRLGVPMSTLLRMMGNVGVDFVISAIPLVGWVGDVFYRSNLRNMDLLRRHLDKAHLVPNRFQP